MHVKNVTFLALNKPDTLGFRTFSFYLVHISCAKGKRSFMSFLSIFFLSCLFFFFLSTIWNKAYLLLLKHSALSVLQKYSHWQENSFLIRVTMLTRDWAQSFMATNLGPSRHMWGKNSGPRFVLFFPQWLCRKIYNNTRWFLCCHGKANILITAKKK